METLKLKKVCFVFCNSLFILLLFLTSIFIFPRKVEATPTCSVSTSFSDSAGFIPGSMAIVNGDVNIIGSLNKSSTDVILSRYVYTGSGNWQPVNPFWTSNDIYDEIRTGPYQYSQAKDYPVALGWVYRDETGATKMITCNVCLRVMEREVRGFGTRRLTYPSTTLTTQTVRGSKNYIGLVFGGGFSGDNNGYTPYPNNNPDGSMNAWWWSSQWDSQWAGNYLRPNTFSGRPPWVHISSGSLPTQIGYTLKAPTFRSGDGNGAYCDYGFDNLVIYTRDLQGNSDGSCGSVPPIITSTPSPTPTPILKTKCSKVTGYVRNSVTKKGIAGAKVTAHGIDNSVGNCLGKHYGCSIATTNSSGYFEINCNDVADINTKCLGVYETNKIGFIDAYGAYGPLGSVVWNKNTIMYNNPQVNICGPFYFFDKK